jgi:hypothetical protein
MDQQLIHTALYEFTDRVGIPATWKNARRSTKELHPKGYIRFQLGKHYIEIPAEAKKTIAAAQLPQLQQMKMELGKLLAIAETIPANLQQQLKELDIFFIDAAGNAFIRHDGLYVFAEGKRPKPGKITDARAFSKGGIKVIFQLLLHPDLLNATMRDIAANTEVSLDTVHKTLQALKAMSHLEMLNKNELAWKNPGAILTDWMTEYDRRLKPGLFIGRFDFLRDNDYDRWKQIKLIPDRTCWGGEPAGELLTNNLKPGEWTIYTTETEMELIKNYRIVPRKDGAIKAYKRFWPAQTKEPRFAPPLLVYTDLINTGARRNIEIAQTIFDEHLKDQFPAA